MRVALITGGGRGIGEEVAVSLARQGIRVMICARSGEGLGRVARRIEREGGCCEYRVVDVRNEKDVANYVLEIAEKYGRLDVLINNAGVGIYKMMTDSTTSDWDLIMDTNLKAPFFFMRACIPIMRKQHFGRVINVASQAGRRGFANMSLYCASKFGLVGLTVSAGQEIAGTGVRVSCIYPGYTGTNFFDKFPESFRMPKRPKTPAAVAKMILDELNRPCTTRDKVRELMGRLFDFR